MRIKDKSFFMIPVEELAINLLGKIIVRKMKNGEINRFRITSTESYGGSDDSASHAYKKKTNRNAPMFENGGILYVYLCYGIFELLNIVSGTNEKAEAVLITGVDNIIGPGRVSKKLEITRELNYKDLTNGDEIWLEDDGFKPQEINRQKRVGIGYALSTDQEKLWRFSL
ncbi:MAG: DNA-3-methyladenine glycosylase [Firmicutes bacterium]|nr:DNA-3-methyladenine glycosylase [Bacillota bacterium]